MPPSTEAHSTARQDDGYGTITRSRPSPVTRNKTHTGLRAWGMEEEDSDSGEETVEPAPVRRSQSAGDAEALLSEYRSSHDGQLVVEDSAAKKDTTAVGAALLLLKSFVGTGVLFLPRAFLKGGLVFSSIALVLISALTMTCFLILLDTHERMGGQMTFGKLGKRLVGNWFFRLINFAILISQLGFSSAYVAFTSENMQVATVALFGEGHRYPTWVFVLLQIAILMPASLLRHFETLQQFATPGNILVMLAIAGVYYYNAQQLVEFGPAPDLVMFNSDTWSLFIGTAIFTFEGIGLLLPIKERMEKPGQFKGVLTIVMIIITVLFASVGAMSYAAYGGNTHTVLLLNLPQGDRMVTVMQLMYCVAIILSTPLQFFPVSTIMTKAIFPRNASGGTDPTVKTLKNMLRAVLVVMMACVAWLGASRLDMFVAFVGSFACIPLVFIFPAWMHLSLSGTKGWAIWCLDYFLIAFGTIMMIYTTYLNLATK